jgi:hypothetical protein
LRGRSYNLNAAAAQIWNEKMASVAAYYSFKADNQAYNRSDWFKHCSMMVSQYEKSSGIATTFVTREDLL